MTMGVKKKGRDEKRERKREREREEERRWVFALVTICYVD